MKDIEKLLEDFVWNIPAVLLAILLTGSAVLAGWAVISNAELTHENQALVREVKKQDSQIMWLTNRNKELQLGSDYYDFKI